MIALIADTHALIWFVTGDPRLSSSAREAIRTLIRSGGTLGFSTVSLIEMIYLTEKDRLPAGTLPQITALASRQPDSVQILPVSQDIALTVERVPRGKVPDMPDRIIAATALHLGIPLIGRDRKIRLSVVETIW